MTDLSFPFTEGKIRALRVGDEIVISGVVFTGRDAVHKYLHEGGKLPPGVNLKDGILYHCGPWSSKTSKAIGNGPPPVPPRPFAKSPNQCKSSATFGCAAGTARGARAIKTP